MSIAVLVLKVLLIAATAMAIFVIATNWPSRLDLRVAMRYLRSRRSSRLLSLITVIAVGGVTIGVMALVIVLGVMNGMQNDLREKILVVNPHLRVLTYGEGLRLDDWAEVLRKVRGTDGVVAAAPFVLGQGLISAGHEYAEGVAVTASEPDTGVRPLAQEFAGLGAAVTGLEVRLAHPEAATVYSKQIEDRLGYPYRALDWQLQNRSLFSALKLEKLAMGLVVFLICVVAAFNVVGTLTMAVRDKTREIGILVAMGMPRGRIRRVFLTQGVFIGLTGTVLGAVLGLIAGSLVNRGQLIPIDPSIYFIDHLPVLINPLDAVAVVAASIVIATLAPLYPSVQAARLEPVTAIRYE